MIQTASVSPGGSGKPQHVLLSGGTGFIGQHLARRLLDQGHQVTVWTRRQALADAPERSGLRHVTALDAVPTDAPVDVVVNLAGARILGWPWTAARRQVLMDSRLGPTRQLVDWMARAATRPRLLISGSAIGYYGVQPLGNDSVLSEECPPRPVFMSTLCQAWEQAAAAATRHGVAVACLRFGLVLGRGGALPMLLLPVRLGLGGRLGSGGQWMSWVHIEDVLGAMAHVAQQPALPAFGAWNVTAPEQLRQRDFSRVAASVLRRPCVVPTPGWPVRLALGEQSDLLLQGQRVAPARLLATGYAFRFPALAGALADLA